ncbi:MAG: sulfatase [bacterium]
MTRLLLLARALGAGLAIGALAGVADAVTTAHAFLGREFLLVSVLAWITAMIPAALLLGGIGALLARRDGTGLRSFPFWRVAIPAMLAVFAVWFLVVVHVNVTKLASDTGPQAIAFDLGATVVAAALLALLIRAGGAVGRGRGNVAAFTGSPLALGIAAVVTVGLAAVFWHGGVGAARPPSEPAPEGAPDVVLILIDTLRRDHLSGEGYALPTSPTLDELARRGARFPDFTSQSCYTKPSVASLLTGRYPAGHRVGHLRTILSERLLTLPELFHAGGFRTAMFVANPIVGAEFGFAQGAERFTSLERELTPKTKLGYALFRLNESGRNVPPARALAAILSATERRVAPRRGLDALNLPAAEIFDEYLAWREDIGDEPVFAYLHVMEPHAPYRPPEPERSRFGRDVELVAEHPPTVGLFLPFAEAEHLPEEKRRGLIAAYDGEIAALDRTLADLFARIAASGRPTVIAVTSDHGEEFCEHGGWGHGQSLHRELLDVPLLLAGPGVPAGVEVASPAQLVDIAPTLLELAGLPAIPGLPGRSLVSAARGEPQGPREIVSEIVYGDAYWARALRVDDRKLIVARLGERESVTLFDVASDPDEEIDLAAREPERVAEMRRRLEEIVATAAAGAAETALGEFDAVTRERLEALGYVE